MANGTEAMAAMSKRAIAEGSFTSDLWLPEFQPVRALPGFVGFVDALESGYEATVQNAVQWCQELLALPRHSMLGNRAVARAHFQQAFADHDHKGVEAFINTWFSDEAQHVMNTLVAKLKNKG